MVITDLQTSYSLAASGQGLIPTKTTLNATTAAVQLHVQLTPIAGTGNKDGRSVVRIFVAVSPFDITAAQAPLQLREVAECVELRSNQETAVPKIKVGDLVPALGTYAYVWADVPTFSAAPTLNLKLVELN